jgi:hypothetical protein
MSDGIVWKSASIGATEQEQKNVLSRNGYDVGEPEAQEEAPPVEPQQVPEDEERFTSPEELAAIYEKKRTPEEMAVWQHRLTVGWQDAVEKFRQQYPDYDEVVNKDIAVPWGAHVAAEIKRLGNPGLAYHLGRDRDFLEQLKGCNKPAQALYLIHQLHQRLQPEPEDPRYVVTHRGPVMSRSFRETPALPSRSAKPGTLRAAAQRGDFQEFKRLRAKGRR